MVPNCAYVMGARDQAVDRSGPRLNVLANVWTREYNSLPAMFFTQDLSHCSAVYAEGVSLSEP